ncbi:rab geranylgeranyl transferase escort protein-like protein [Cryomyces antarcticus]|uniref:Rab proteins geranylgeranyltransferase n=1 Tax=Cryomyces antarcticus TaxID=329879 RepID=A0ABR0M8U8_9PEZI|nr:Rab proteins geranylgeranyltransferase component A [Cryomyces antarcticus]
MESLDGTTWDVLIAGTGIQQSLLSLALSRSGKKVLHIDSNDYYGGDEAAFSLQDAESWCKSIGEGGEKSSFKQAVISQISSDTAGDEASKLSFSRAYSLSLSPQLIYARSPLLPVLVSSRIDRQLEFQAVGSWWVYSQQGHLVRVPSGREDVFADTTIDVRAKRSLMKFLRFVANYEDQPDMWEPYRSKPFPAFLTEQFRLPPALHDPLLALTLSPSSPRQISTEPSLAKVARHLRSIGVFGPGFRAVIPKWGGLAEITQVACRAGAVGGAVCVLNRGVDGIEDNPTLKSLPADEPKPLSVRLRDKNAADTETVTAEWVIGDENNLPPLAPTQSTVSASSTFSFSVLAVTRSMSIVSSTLASLFPAIAEGVPQPAGAVVVFPSGNLFSPDRAQDESPLPPVHAFVHSSDTGECPAGQCVIYASTATAGPEGSKILDEAVARLLQNVGENPTPQVLWSMRYEQSSSVPHPLPPMSTVGTGNLGQSASADHVLIFPPSSLDLAFDDAILQRVRSVWEKIMGAEAEGFMTFEDREGMGMEAEGEDQD